MSLFSEIVNESELLTELKDSREKDVIYAINNMLHVRIGYNDEQGGKGKRERNIYPVAYGLTKRGNKAIRAFQTAGSTKRGAPKWKLFLFDRIFSWSTGHRSYKDQVQKLIDLDFNVSGDLGMTQIFAIAPIARGDVMVTSPDNSNLSANINKDDVDQTSNVQNPKINTSTNYQKASQERNADIDNNKNDVYIDNSNSQTPIDAPKTEPFVKTKTAKQNQTKGNDNETIGNLSAKETGPINKDDIVTNQNNTNDNIDKDNETEKNEPDAFQTKVSDLMNRMNNLYKDNEDNGNI